MVTKRLIDAIALISKARRMETTDNNGIPVDTFAVPVMAIEDAPTVEAVEVVRCKDCKLWNNRGCGDRFGFCEAWEGMRKADGYCDCGERKEDG